MTKIATGYTMPDDLNSEMSDAEIKERLLSQHKQEDVKKKLKYHQLF